MSTRAISFLDRSNAVARLVLSGGLVLGAAACTDALDATSAGASLSQQAADTALINVAPLGSAVWTVTGIPGNASLAVDSDPRSVARGGSEWRLALDQAYEIKFVTVRRCDGCINAAEGGVLRVDQWTLASLGEESVSTHDVNVTAGLIGIDATGEGTLALSEVEVWAVPNRRDDEPPEDECRDPSDFDRDGVGDSCDSCPYQYNPEQGTCASTGGRDPVAPPAPAREDDDSGGCSAGGAPPGGLTAAALMTAALALFVGRRRRVGRTGSP